jgi:hypothetical protein
VVDVVRRRDEMTYVYNVEIEGLHTYFVSAIGVLSHNACSGNLIGNLSDLDPQEVEFVNKLLSRGKNVEIIPTEVTRTPELYN